jgi:transcription initiation factor TFIIIB Brf1 subunit/transcription initiation factor TFIIB
MRSYSEYIPCSCGAWARIVRAEDRQHRDKIVCATCGRVTIDDNIPEGRRVELKEDEDNDTCNG